MNVSELVFVSSDYKVIALDKADGKVVWESILVTKFFKPAVSFVTLVVDDSGLYAHAINQLYRLDLSTGVIIWQRELPTDRGLSRQEAVCIATLGSSSISALTGAAAATRENNNRFD